MTLEEAEEDFNYWNDFWLKGCYDPKTEADLWEAEQGEKNENHDHRIRQ